jgi:hypothetical protein
MDAVTQNSRAWRHGATIFACAGLALLIASLTVFKMSNNDIWIHLTTGRQILETWQVPDKDPYSFTALIDYVAQSGSAAPPHRTARYVNG